MPGLPAAQDAELRAYTADGFAAAARAEMAAIENRTSPRVRQTEDLVDRPLIVLSAGQTIAVDPLFYELHDELAALSTRGIHRGEEGATHPGMVFDATHAEATIAAIEEVVRATTGSQGRLHNRRTGMA
jgi:hypothetical protein